MTNPLLCPPEEKAERETKNGIEQIDFLSDLINHYQIKELRESHVLQLHKLAVQDIYPCGGEYRDARFTVTISGSAHVPPPPAFVPSLVQELISRVNESKDHGCALERAAFALWRFNWIHPFAGGNGRTARAVTYLIICIDMEMMLPGVPTLPALIYERRADYVAALKHADATAKNGDDPDLKPMVEYLRELVTRQMASAIAKLVNARAV